MVILGGINTTLGPVIGAAFISIFPVEVAINPFWQEILFGGLFIAVIVAYPAGFVGLLRALGRRRRASACASRPRLGRAVPAVAATSGTGAVPIEIGGVEAAARAGAEHPEAVPGDASPRAAGARRCRRVPRDPLRLHARNARAQRRRFHGQTRARSTA